MNYQPEVRRSLCHSDRKRKRSSYKDTSSEANEDTKCTSQERSKTRLSNQEEETSNILHQQEDELQRQNFYRDFECAICLETVQDPHLLPDCCHRFCGGCIKESIAKGNKQCPTCRENITTKRCLRKDDLMEKLLMIIEKLQEENIYLKHALEKKEQKVIEPDKSYSAVKDCSVKDATIGAVFDHGENELKSPTKKKRKTIHIQEAKQVTYAVDTAKKILSFDERFNSLKEFKRQHGHCKTRLDNREEEETLNINQQDGLEKKAFYKEFICAICLEKLTDPHLLPDCCHRFCGPCIKESISKGNMTCPSCRERITTKRCLRKDDLFQKLLFRFHRLKDENAHLKHTLEIKEQGVMEQDNFEKDENQEHDYFEKDDNQKHDDTAAPKRKKRKVSKSLENAFEKRFNALKEFKSEYGHCNVPYAYNAHNNLGQWVPTLRRMKSGSKKNGGAYKLTNERIKNLENIGFRWTASQTFDERFNNLKEFKSEHGHCDVPKAYKAQDNLGEWVQTLRRVKSGSKKNGGAYKLTNERIKNLEKIGFRWHSNQTFDERFNALKEFKSEHGHCNIPYAYNAHNNLGQWVKIVRQMKSGSIENSGIHKLTNERIKNLENIGFRWHSNQTFDQRFNALKEFIIIRKSLLILITTLMSINIITSAREGG